MMTDRFFLYPTEKASREHSYYLLKSGKFVFRYVMERGVSRNFLRNMSDPIEASPGSGLSGK